MSKFKVGDIVLPTGKMEHEDYDDLKSWLEESPLGIGRVVRCGEDGSCVLENPYTKEEQCGFFYESELRLVK